MTSPPIRVAIDAMGGDYAPDEIVRGAVLAAREHQIVPLLVGPQAVIEESLKAYDTTGLGIEIVPASDVVAMGDAPTSALRRKKDASIAVTARCVKTGEAQAMVAAGSTGAAMAAALLTLGRLDGIDRPAIGVVLPSLSSPCLLLDAGANADCTPEMLVQFARMGNAFMHSVYNMAQPRVGLLNIGEETGKGNALVNTVYERLAAEPGLHFMGNIEGSDLFRGHADVAVCDGFVGNVALKSIEGVSKMLLTQLKNGLMADWPSRFGALLVKRAVKQARAKVDPNEHGGALLLGVRGICVIAHGSSNANAIVNAVRVAKNAVSSDVLGKMGGRLPESASAS